MPLPDFKYYLFSKAKRPLYVDEKGFVQEGSEQTWQKPDGQPAHLQYAPDGWKDTLVKYARNIKYWGLFRDMTVPMKFVRDGGKILKNRMWNFGVECICYLGILKLDRTQLPYTYKSWFLSEINFVKFKQGLTDVQVEALEGGLSKYLKAYESTEYKIPIDDDEQHISVLMDGMELANTGLFSVTNGFDPDISEAWEFGSHLVDLQIVNKEIEDIGGIAPVIRTKVPNDNTQITATGKWFFEATSDATVEVSYNFDLNVEYVPPPGINPAATMACVVRKIDKNGIGTSTILVSASQASFPIGGTYHAEGTKSISVHNGDKLYLYTFGNPSGSTGDAQMRFTYSGAEPFLKINYTFRQAPTQNSCLWPYRLAEKLLEKITEAEPGRYTLKSDFLKSLTYEIAMASGDSLRRISKSFIKTTLSDFFKSFNRWGIGLGVEGDQLVIEKLEYFFQKGVITDVGEVKDASVSVSDDLLFNTISLGYKQEDYQEINGRYEFNQGQKWALPITRVTKDLDLVSVYRADPFGIELLRINFGEKKTTDSDSDNDTFFLNVKKNFTSFTTTLSFGTLFLIPVIIVQGKPEMLSKFTKGVRFSVMGTTLNDGTYTVTEDAHLGADPSVFFIPVNKPLQNEDNKVATLEIAGYILNRPAYTLVEGLLYPGTAFNIELSPKRSLLLNGRFIRSCMDTYLDAEKVRFTSADKNTDLKTTLNGVTISEQEDVQIGSLGELLFRPYYFNFTTQVPVNLPELVNQNPYGKVKFSVNNVAFYGFLMDGGIKPATNDTQQWKLLCAPESDLKKFQNAAF
jgi:hypothetical protein